MGALIKLWYGTVRIRTTKPHIAKNLPQIWAKVLQQNAVFYFDVLNGVIYK